MGVCDATPRYQPLISPTTKKMTARTSRKPRKSRTPDCNRRRAGPARLLSRRPRAAHDLRVSGSGYRGSRRLGPDVAQHRMEDAPVAVVVDLDRGIEAAGHLEGERGAVGPPGGDAEALPRSQRFGGEDVVGLGAIEAEHHRVVPADELQRQYAHAHQVGTVDPFEALRDDGLHAKQVRALGCPVAARAHAVVLPGDDDGRYAGRQVVAARLEDAGDRAAGEVGGPPALGVRRDLVLEPDVGEGAAGHDAIVAAA